MKKGCLFFIVICALLFWWCGSSSKKAAIDAGYNLCLQKLSAPTTAVLLEHVEIPSEVFEKTGWQLNSGYSCVVYEIEAQNVIGGREREEYMVLFSDNKPIYVDTAPKGNSESIRYYFEAASINTRIDRDVFIRRIK